MSYLDIARAVVHETRETRKAPGSEAIDASSGYEINEINEKSRVVGGSRPHRPVNPYEINEKSPAPSAGLSQDDTCLEKQALKAEILEAAPKVGPDFDPEHYITVWRRYEALGGRVPICNACPEPDVCLIRGPRGPQFSNGPCPAYPIAFVAEAHT